MLHFTITEPYLWIPFDHTEPEVKLHFYVDGKKIQEIDMRLGGTSGDFYACMEVGGYLGRDLEIRADVSKELLDGIFCYAQKPQNVYPFRPKLHFSPQVGWHNDPNGLVYADGQYHLYYQWNPYGVEWGNMHWGHAVSRDLLYWEHEPMVMAPNEKGAVYSGCAWEDRENQTGHGEHALLFYYTAAGGRSEWSVEAGNPLFTQRLAVSTDAGKTLRDSDAFFMGHIMGENRDPKICYHESLGTYHMVLYLDGNTFAFFRSVDLQNWEETQRLTMEGMWECPDLFELSVDGTDGEKKWVFWSADGYYVVGDFDGFQFTPQSEVLCAYGTKLPYAAQTYAGIKGRIVSIAWLRLQNTRGNYKGIMSLPAELSLVKQGQGYRIRLQPVRELTALRGFLGNLPAGQRQASIPLNGNPMEICLSWNPETDGQTKLTLGNTAILVDFAKAEICVHETGADAQPAAIPFDSAAPLSLQIVIDQEALEFYGNGGVLYGAAELEENALGKVFGMESGVDLLSAEWYVLGEQA